MSALLANSTPSAAARKLGVSTNTVLKRLREPKFAEELRQRRSEVLQDSVDVMQKLIGNALCVLNKIMTDESAPASVRVQACNSILSNYLQYADYVALERRVANLEQNKDGN